MITATSTLGIWTKIRAAKYIKLDYFEYHEKIIKILGKQSLGRSNKIFYENFFSHCMNSIGSEKKVLIIDVGANDGWFAKVATRFLTTDYKIICYEPLKEMRKYLGPLAEQSGQRIEYRPYGLGAANTSATINSMETSGLSSLKTISNTYSYGEGFSQEILNSYTIPIKKLDDESFGDDAYSLKVLKIDTQGYEIEVLNGAEISLSKRDYDYILVEVMSLTKYTDGATYDKIIALITKYGYTLFDIHPAYYEKDGQCTEYDIIFRKILPSSGAA